MRDEIRKDIEDIFKAEEDISYEFKEVLGLTFVFTKKIYSINDRLSSAEISPAGIIYEENGENYFAPLYDTDDIEGIVKEYVEKMV